MVLLNRKDWVSMFKARSDMTEAQAREAVEAMSKALLESLEKGNIVKIPGVGTIRRNYSAPRSQFVGHLNRFYNVPASYIHSFKPVQSLKARARRDAETNAHPGA